MKNVRLVLCLAIVFVMCFGSFVAEAAYETQENDVELICDLAVEYVNSGSEDDFAEYMSEGVGRLVSQGDFTSSKFVYLYEEDPDFIDVSNNQLSKMVTIINEIYVKGGEAKLKQSDINKNVTPGYSVEAGVEDYQEDDAEVFMEIITSGKERLKPVKSEAETEKKADKTDKKDNKKDGMPPETNNEATKKQNSSEGGVSLGVVILVSIIVSSIVFAAGVYALRQVEAKKGPADKKGAVDGDEVYNLRMAVKSMQTSLQKADGNFQELDKLRIQVDEMDEKLEHITEYLRKLNRSE